MNILAGRKCYEKAICAIYGTLRGGLARYG